VKITNIIPIILLLITQKTFAQNYTLVWSDSFTNNIINTNNWIFESGTGNSGWGNNELQYYTNRLENATIQNGNLMIIAKKELYAGSNYTSARMTTKGLREFTYGKIEARIKLPQTQGVWPAFWMLGSNIDQVNWPECGELDIMEHINTEAKIHGTMHWNKGGHFYIGSNISCNASNWHTYSIEWTMDSIIWQMDNNVYYKNTIKNNVNSTAAFHKPFFLLLNMAVGGNWPGSPNANSIFPDTMFVDYVNVFQKFALDVNDENNLQTVKIFPNPVQDFLHIETENKQLENLYIYNDMGVMVKNILLDKKKITHTIDISGLANGNYYYRINANGSVGKKGSFIKE
jgi:beta-glucanase (GH16 family)